MLSNCSESLIPICWNVAISSLIICMKNLRPATLPSILIKWRVSSRKAAFHFFEPPSDLSCLRISRMFSLGLLNVSVSSFVLLSFCLDALLWISHFVFTSESEFFMFSQHCLPSIRENSLCFSVFSFVLFLCFPLHYFPIRIVQRNRPSSVVSSVPFPASSHLLRISASGIRQKMKRSFEVIVC